MKYKICKDGIFKSIQGEGYNTGKSAVFVRFSECNMKPHCWFCDESFDEFNLIDDEAIVKEITSLEPFSMVIITGGEPTMNDLSGLIQLLKSKGYYVTVETNGIINSNFDFDWITCSPKTLDIDIKYANELKFVVDKNKESMEEFIQKICDKVKCEHIFLQPKSNDENCIATAIEMIKSNPQYRLSLQTHKMIGIK